MVRATETVRPKSKFKSIPISRKEAGILAQQFMKENKALIRLLEKL